MLASSVQGTNDQDVDGIVKGHAYTILGTINFDAHGRHWQLVKLRNPWGKNGEWNGDWGDNSDLWTP